MPMIAITTKSSTSVNAERPDRRADAEQGNMCTSAGNAEEENGYKVAPSIPATATGRPALKSGRPAPISVPVLLWDSGTIAVKLKAPEIKSNLSAQHR